MNSELENLVWEQKYRPRDIESIILPESTKNMILELIESNNLPNILMAGNSGMGKTTLARAITTKMDADLLFINASLENGIDNLRTTITQFVSTVSFSGSKKIVLLDECEQLSHSTQTALRGFIDEFSSNSTFIFTCNHKSKVIPALISRLTVLDFKFTKEEKNAAAVTMMKRCCQILDQENIKYDKKVVGALVIKNFPDFRKTLVDLQQFSISGNMELNVLSTSSDEVFAELITAIKEKNFKKCRQWVANNQYDSAKFYRSLYDKLLLSLVPASVPQIILIIANSQYQASNSVDQEINQISAIIQIMGVSSFQ